MLKHGGGVQQAALKYGLPADKWLDLSTGINPIGWVVPEISAAKWLRLPEDDDGLANLGTRLRMGQFLFSQTSQALSQSTPGRRVHVFMPEATLSKMKCLRFEKLKRPAFYQET